MTWEDEEKTQHLVDVEETKEEQQLIRAMKQMEVVSTGRATIWRDQNHAHVSIDSPCACGIHEVSPVHLLWLVAQLVTSIEDICTSPMAGQALPIPHGQTMT